jgi:hypothetical protein
MITYSRLGYRGNFGNQLFQIAALISLSKKHNQNYCIPKWKYAEFFDFEYNVGYADESFIEIKEKKFEFHEWNINNGNFDLDGWFQTEKYFDIELINKTFTLKPNFLKVVKSKKEYLFNKKNILISIRRDDYIGHPYFHQLSYKYYLLAIIENFPDWKERNIVFTSDSFSYCKFHFGFLKNAYFIDDLTMIEQFALGTQFDDYIISNSTFQWWMAWLGEKKETRIIHPIKFFRGKYAEQNNDKDFFPERWISFDDRNYNLSNEFIKLKIRGFLYQVFSLIKCRYSQYLKKVKDFVKKLIKWLT